MSRCSGSVLAKCEDITRVSAQDRVKRGLIEVPEGRLGFPMMSVLENLDGGLPAGVIGPQTAKDMHEVFGRLPALAIVVSSPRARCQAVTVDAGDGAGADGLTQGAARWMSRPWVWRRRRRGDLQHHRDITPPAPRSCSSSRTRYGALQVASRAYAHWTGQDSAQRGFLKSGRPMKCARHIWRLIMFVRWRMTAHPFTVSP